MDMEFAYNKALDYLYSFVDYSLKHASELAKADFNLDRMQDLMSALGNPEQKYPVIHVAGTKGKGSTCVLMACALQAAGFKTGMYTSPHLVDYVERIQVNGEAILHADLVDAVRQVEPHVAGIRKLTTFEITTAIGLLLFAQKEVDVAVVEVGLGGRLDATNIVTPMVSVITSLSYDHTAVLGDTLEKIAGEKAGIIKPGIPVVSSPQKKEALEVLERIACERGCSFTLVGRDITCRQLKHSLKGQSLELSAPHEPPLTVEISLLGSYQALNAATAFTALKASGLKISNADIQKGFFDVKWPARFEVVNLEPPVILDSAHNIDSACKLLQALDDYFPGIPVILIFGASEDKDVQGMFSIWKPRLQKIIITRADHPRALDPRVLSALAEETEIPFEVITPVEAALKRAVELAGSKTIVLSSGSMFVTAEAITAWRKLEPALHGAGR